MGLDDAFFPPRGVHNRDRRTKAGKPPQKQVLRGLDILKRRRAAFNTLTLVTRASVGRGLRRAAHGLSLGNPLQIVVNHKTAWKKSTPIPHLKNS